MSQSIKVVIVDDSALIRRLMTRILEKDPVIDVVGVAQDAFVAREMIKKLNPDVITLDIEMPKMDGITFLSNLMRIKPMPVVMVSSLTQKNADITLQALELGAVDFVTKPRLNSSSTLEDYSAEITRKIKMASAAKVHARPPDSIQGFIDSNADVGRTGKTLFNPAGGSPFDVIAIGASTGGTEAIREILSVMPATSPCIVVTQHIPEGFSEVFARRLNSISALEVTEASGGEKIRPGHAYVAPGDKHLTVERKEGELVCRVEKGAPVNYHIPSVDVLFYSIAEHLGKKAIGVILTGMGSDGAAGLKEMYEAGAMTFAQDEKSSVIWGMPGEAVSRGGVQNVLPLKEIPGKILRVTRKIAA